MSLGIDGISSGFDTTALIKALLEADRKPIQTLQTKRDDLTFKQDTFKAVNDELYRLQQFALALRLESTFKSKLITSSDETKLTAVATTDAARGTHVVSVLQIAEAARAESEVVRTFLRSDISGTAGVSTATGSAVGTTEGTHSLSFTSGRSGRIIGRVADLDGEMTLGQLGVTTLNGLKFSIDGVTGRLSGLTAQTTLNELIEKINTSVPNVRAELIGTRVVLTGAVGGRDFTMTDTDTTNGVVAKVFGFSSEVYSAAEIIGGRTQLTAATTLGDVGVSTFNSLGVIINGTRYTLSSSGPYNAATTIATVLADFATDVPGITAGLTSDGRIALRATSASTGFELVDANYANDIAAQLFGISGRQSTQNMAVGSGVILTAASSGAHILSGATGLSATSSLQSLGVATATGFTIRAQDGHALTFSGLSTHSSVQDLVDAINASAVPIVAQLIGGRIQLTATDGGRNFTISDANYTDSIARQVFGVIGAQSTADSAKGTALVTAAEAGWRGSVVGDVSGLTLATTLGALGISAGNENDLVIRASERFYTISGLNAASTVQDLIDAIEASGAPVNARLYDGRLMVEAEGNNDTFTLQSSGYYDDGVLSHVFGYQEQIVAGATITSAVSGLTLATSLDGAIGRGITDWDGFTITLATGTTKKLTFSGTPPTVEDFLQAVNKQVTGVRATLTASGAIQLRGQIVGMNFRVSDDDYVGTIAGELFQLTRAQSTLLPSFGNALVTAAPTGSQILGLELSLFSADFADNDKTAGGTITLTTPSSYSGVNQRLHRIAQAPGALTDRVMFGDPTWADYAVEFNAEVVSTVTNQLSVELRYDAGTGNTYRADVTNAGINVYYDIGGGDVLVGAIGVPAGFSINQKHDYRFEIEGTNIRAYVDGTFRGVVGDATSGGSITSGITTFRTDDDAEDVYWDAIRIKPLMSDAGDDALLTATTLSFGVQSPETFGVNFRNSVTQAPVISTIQELLSFFNGHTGVFAEFNDPDITAGGTLAYEYAGGGDPWLHHAPSNRLHHQPGIAPAGTDRVRFGDSSMSDYSVEFKAELDAGTVVATELRYDPTAGTYYRVEFSSGSFDIYYNDGGGDTLLTSFTPPTGFSGIANEHRYTVSLEDNTFRISVDGVFVGQYTDTVSSGSIRAGGATLVVDDADDVYFDDLRLVPLQSAGGLSAELVGGRLRVTADDPRQDFGLGDVSSVYAGTISKQLFGLNTTQFTYAKPQGTPLVTAASTGAYTVADIVVPLHGGSPEFHTTTGMEGVALNYLYEGGSLLGTGYNQSFVNGEAHLYTSAELAAGLDTATKVQGGVDVGQTININYNNVYREAKAGTYYIVYNYTGAPSIWHYVITNADGVVQGEGVRGSATAPDQFVAYADSDLAGSSFTHYYPSTTAPSAGKTYSFTLKLDTSVALQSAGFSTPASESTNGVFTINGIAIRIEDYTTQSVNEVLALINSSGAGVIARYDDQDDRFIVVSTRLGSGGAVTLGAAGDTSDFLRIAKLTSATGAVTATGQDNKTIATDQAVGSAGSNLSLPVTSGTFTINGVRLFVDAAKDSLNDIIKRINNSGAKVIATYDKATDRLILRNDTEDPGNLTNANRIQIGSASDTSNFFEAVRFGVASQAKTTRLVGQAGKDAKLVVNGSTYLRSSNTIDDILQGVTLTLMAATETPVSINVEVDAERPLEALADFVAQYNKIIDLLNPKVLTRSERKYLEPLSDEKRKNMTFAEIEDYEALHEQYKKQELIRTDQAYRRILDALRRAVLGPVTGLPDDMDAIRDLGIDTYLGPLSLVTKGHLVYESSDPEEIRKKLDDITGITTTLQQMSEAVYNLFAIKAYTGSGTQAISTQKVTISGLTIPDGAGPLTFKVGDGANFSTTITLYPGHTYTQDQILKLLDRAGLNIGDGDNVRNTVNVGAGFDSDGRLVLTAINSGLSRYEVILQDGSRGGNTLVNVFGFDIPANGAGISRLFDAVLGGALKSNGILGDRVRIQGSIDREIDRVNDTITAYERRVSDREASLYRKYQAMEKALSTLKSQGDYIAQQLAAMQSALASLNQ